jgi:hypothetical protein
MAKAKNNDKVNYISKNATLEEIIEFILTDNRAHFSAFKMDGMNAVLKSQSKETVYGFIDTACAWEPTKIQQDAAILLDYTIDAPQYRKSATAPMEEQLDQEGVELPENAAFIKHHVSFTFYTLTDKKESELDESKATEEYLSKMQKALLEDMQHVVRVDITSKKNGSEITGQPCARLFIPEPTAEEPTAEEQPTVEEPTVEEPTAEEQPTTEEQRKVSLKK